MKMKRTVVLFVLLMLFAFLSVTVRGAELDFSEDELSELEGSLPDEVRDRLPDSGLENTDSFGQSVAEMSKSDYMVSLLTEFISLGLKDGLILLVSLLAVVAVSAVLAALSGEAQSSALAAAMRFCSSAALISVVMHTVYGHFTSISELFEKLGVMMQGMIPITASLWAMGGNVSTASAGGAAFYVILNVSEALLAGTLIPVCSVLTVLGFCDSLSEEVKTGRIMNAIKKIYNFLLGAIMTLLLASLGAQTAIAASADTAAAKTARLLSGSLIPVVGGGVGDTFRTLAGGVSYLKNIFGVGGILMIAIAVLPVFISVLMTRFAFLMAGGIADMLGCGVQARMLENLGEVWGTMLGVIASVSVTFVLALCIFMQTVVAVM